MNITLSNEETIKSIRDQLAEKETQRQYAVQIGRENIERLEAYNATRTDELIAAMRCIADLEKDKIDSEHWFKQQWVEQQARIAELVEALITHQKLTRPIQTSMDALSRTDNMEALNEYRNQVIEEVASWKEQNITTPIRALKKEITK